MEIYRFTNMANITKGLALVLVGDPNLSSVYITDSQFKKKRSSVYNYI